MVTKDGNCFEVQQHAELSLDKLFSKFQDEIMVYLFTPFSLSAMVLLLSSYTGGKNLQFPLRVFGLVILCWASQSRE